MISLRINSYVFRLLYAKVVVFRCYYSRLHLQKCSLKNEIKKAYNFIPFKNYRRKNVKKNYKNNKLRSDK